MKSKIFFLIILFVTSKLHSQEVEKIYPFYLDKIPSFKSIYDFNGELNKKELKEMFAGIKSIKMENSFDRKFYKENNQSILEIYDEKKNISMKLIRSNDKNEYIMSIYFGGEIKYEIPYRNGKVNGIYKVYYYDDWAEINYKDGLKNGLRKIYRSNNKQIIEVVFLNEKVSGKIKIIDTERNNFMLYPNNLEGGIIEYYDSHANLYCKVPFINKTFVQGEVIDYYYHSKNIRSVKNHKLGKLDGKTEYFDEKGNSKFINYFKNGMPIGNYKEFYLNGGIYEDRFYDDNGIKIGTWITYDESDKIIGELPYINGKINGVEKKYFNGIVICTKEYKDDKLNGSVKHWNSYTKNIESESYMVDDKNISIIYYFRNGKISRKFENNIKSLPIKAEYYDKNGNLFYEEKYNAEKSSEGVHKYYFYDSNEDYFLSDEEEFDKNEFKVREKNYMKNDDFIEKKYNTNGTFVKTIFKNKITTTEYIHYGKKISVEEYNKINK